MVSFRRHSCSANCTNNNVITGVGALVAFPCIKAHSFGGFCAAIFIIGNGLGSLETAANPYITGTISLSTLLSQHAL